MAIKTFTTGEVLTAADTNTYLANAGWNVITPSSVTGGTLSGAKVTIGSAQSTVTVNGVYSTTFNAYKILIVGSSASASANNVYYKQGGSTGATYYSNGYYMSAGSTVVNGMMTNAASTGIIIALTSNTFWSSTFEVHNPFATAATTLTGQAAGSAYASTTSGYDSNAASSTSFSLTLSAGTITGGTIMIYGFRVG